MIYILIFVAKVFEVSLYILRSIVVQRDMRFLALTLAGVEIVIWLSVTTKVLLDIQEDIYKGVAYVVSVYLGMFIEDKLALGLSRIEVVAEK